jgi:hypothetical protein
MSKEKYELEQQMLDALVHKHDLQFTYVRPLDDQGCVLTKGGAVFAWTWPKEKSSGNMIQLSVVWCPPNEAFNKKIGRVLAAVAFEQGKQVAFRLPVTGNVQPISATLKELFQQCVY